ncbi:DNA polymerase III subunit beta [Paraferrimonas sp. SM1919]|uniref:DNA polymerase III subunit beta n=1 Tax=Paraferrimonas sp. SM1919 TaxID=2662263 RepID=UPI0013D4A033|nr:DNA polymerase III subunit beta [Paraferrimonas sp. SM1919]
MKFTIDRDSLLKPIQLVSGAVERRHNLPILANILVQVTEQQLRLTGTDLEVELVGQIPLEGNVVVGSTTVPAKKFLDIVRSLPEAPINIELAGDRLLLISGRSRFSLSTLPASDYPNIDEWQPDIELTLTQGTLKSLIEATQFSMANQDVRYYLNGLLFETDGNVLRTVATDGHRLALSYRNIEHSLPKKQMIVPRKGVVELSRLLDNPEATIAIAIGQNSIRAATNDSTLTSKLVDGRFPDYERVLPKGGDKVVVADREWLRQCLLRASILCNEKFRGVQLNVTNGQMKITANNPEQEEAVEIIDIDYQGDDIEIGFNVSYLLDVMNGLTCKDVRLTLKDGGSSVLIENCDFQDSMYVVMPMRI